MKIADNSLPSFTVIHGALLLLGIFLYAFLSIIIVDTVCLFITIFCMRERVPSDTDRSSTDQNALDSGGPETSKLDFLKLQLVHKSKTLRCTF